MWSEYLNQKYIISLQSKALWWDDRTDLASFSLFYSVIFLRGLIFWAFDINWTKHRLWCASLWTCLNLNNNNLAVWKCMPNPPKEHTKVLNNIIIRLYYNILVGSLICCSTIILAQLTEHGIHITSVYAHTCWHRCQCVRQDSF